jgi:uncharacterized protein YraI/surface antigen
MSAPAQRRLQSANQNLLIVTLCCLLIAVFTASGRAGATTYTYQVTIPGATSGTVNERSGPGTNYSLVGTISDGASIVIACQTSGTNVDGTLVWDELNTSVYISDYYTNTPTPYGFTSSIPQCTSVPAPPSAPSAPASNNYQIAIPQATNGTVNERSGPGTNYSVVGTIADGSPITISCQTSGSSVGGTSIWDQLSSGPFVSDYYTNTPTIDGFTTTIPQCTSVPAPPTSTPSSPTPPPSSVGATALGQTIGSNPYAEDDFCTWYAEVRFHDFVSHYPAMYPAGHTFINVGGNAYQWRASAIQHGWTVTSTPTVNSIVVFQPGVERADPNLGHVAWVTAVSPGGHFTVTELNADLSNGDYNSSYQPDVNRYYHATTGVSFILVPF